MPPRGYRKAAAGDQITLPSRADEVRQERRKRPGLAAYSGIKLMVDETKLDRNTYQYRFANDTPGRIPQLMALDYDPAPEMGKVTSAHAGVSEGGQPYNTVLMRKRRDWFDDDQREKQRPLDEIDDAIRRGNINHPANQLNGNGGFYTPDTGNTLERA